VLSGIRTAGYGLRKLNLNAHHGDAALDFWKRH
jgi:hypothetical protein